MARIDELAYFFRSPEYPVIVDIDGSLVAAKSPDALLEKLLRLDLQEQINYSAMDGTGESWALVVCEQKGVLSPFSFAKRKTKKSIIRWFNGRENKPGDEVEYSEKSLSSKRLDLIIAEIADRLLDADC